jgi:assimilatory nitrate reductase catalytic subunit
MRCAVGCGHIQDGVEEGYGIANVRGDASHPVSRGQACQRGIEESESPGGEWLTQPLVRKRGRLRRADWSEALDHVELAFRKATETSPHGAAVFGSGQQTNEAAYALGKVARGGIGTRYYDANTTLCMASAVTAYYDAFGSDAPPCSYDDIPEARSHVVWGANPAVAHPVMFRWIEDSADADDSRLLVVDPVETQTASAADSHVRPDPGTDLALARAVLARIIERGAVDEAFVDRATVGFETLHERLPTGAAAAETAGVSLADVDAIATALSDPTLLYWGMGVNQSVQGTAAAGALIDLCLATGNLQPGSGPFSLTGQANSMGTRVCSSKGTWPGQRSFADPDERRTVADAWDVPVDRLPDEPGPGPVGTFAAIEEGPVEAVWTVATNPVAGMPDTARVRERLDEAFLVVQDAFRTETTELADVVLPAATWGESDGTAINMERTVSRVRPATGLAAGVRTDLDIVTAVGERLSPGLFAGTGDDPEATFEEFVALTAGTEADCSGLSYDRLDEELAVRWPAPDTDASGGYRYHGSDGWSFPTQSGAARFSTGSQGTLPEPPNETYPLTLTTGREPDGYNTGIRSRPVAPPGLLTARVAPGTAGDLDDETVTLETRRAAVEATLNVDPTVPEGMVWVPIHHPDANRLTLPEVDPRSAEPNFKQCAVRLLTAPEADGPAALEREVEVSSDD